jgi:hypothetical protein
MQSNRQEHAVQVPPMQRLFSNPCWSLICSIKVEASRLHYSRFYFLNPADAEALRRQ